jgi:ATP-binding protein involved in chromosome partitioning
LDCEDTKAFRYTDVLFPGLFVTMTTALRDTLDTLLRQINLPDTGIVLADCCSVLQASDNRIALELHLPFASGIRVLTQTLQHQLSQQLAHPIPLDLSTRIESYRSANADKAPPNKAQAPKTLPGVKNVIAIASGKGGVGKSTTAINLALALQQEGARVGVLDADIFGPSQSMLSGVAANTRPEVKDQKFFIPVKAHGLQIMSMAFLVTEQTPVVWRGPMASGALQQMMNQTAWDNLDYLIVDMPPGTGDIQLTLSQSCPVTAAVIVTTPQDIALLDAVKGIEMFRKVDVPILGIIENMSTHICSKCGHEESIFGSGGGEKVARDYQTPLLGQLPLDISIRKQSDRGMPIVIAEPQGKIAQIYRRTALRMAAELTKLKVERGIPNVVSIR